MSGLLWPWHGSKEIHSLSRARLPWGLESGLYMTAPELKKAVAPIGVAWGSDELLMGLRGKATYWYRTPTIFEKEEIFTFEQFYQKYYFLQPEKKLHLYFSAFIVIQFWEKASFFII
jgi:hypothetical protein